MTGRHRGRASRLRRAVALGGALALTVAVGVVALVVGVPGGASDVAAAGTESAFVTQRLEPVAAPTPEVTEEPFVAAAVEDPPVPEASGEGRRIVFDQGDQRVWLIGDDGDVERTYPVSGSRFDNLQPGSYQVQSRTRHAVSFDYSGTMEYFVRFATGYSEPIGFHSVPVDNAGNLEQTEEQLGTPLSAGCVRQWKPDAIALWEFAPVGTPVVVTA